MDCQCSKLIHSQSLCRVTKPRSLCRYKSKRNSLEQILRASERGTLRLGKWSSSERWLHSRQRHWEALPAAGWEKGHCVDLGYRDGFSWVKSLWPADYHCCKTHKFATAWADASSWTYKKELSLQFHHHSLVVVSLQTSTLYQIFFPISCSVCEEITPRQQRSLQLLSDMHWSPDMFLKFSRERKCPSQLLLKFSGTFPASPRADCPSSQK